MPKSTRRHIMTLSLITRTLCLFIVALSIGVLNSTAANSDTSSKVLKITTKRDGDKIRFSVENLVATEVTATFELDMTNLQCSEPMPVTRTFKANETAQPFYLTPVRNGETWNYNYTSRYTLGSSVAVHDDAYVYTLPFAPDSAYRVTQGYNGSYSHTGPDQYAIDFKMPVGTPVYAAREGMVVKAKVDSTTGGPNRSYLNSANYILIRHADGTLANYAHLRKNGTRVTVGQNVRAGELIGYSGNTGFSSGPHMHFSVFKTRNGSQRETVPVFFKTTDDYGITLVEGKNYRCTMETRPGAYIAAKPAVKGVRPSKAAVGSGSPGDRH